MGVISSVLFVALDDSVPCVGQIVPVLEATITVSTVAGEAVLAVTLPVVPLVVKCFVVRVAARSA